MKPLAPAQAAVLGFIVRTIRARSIPPTIREMCDWAGWSGNNAAVDVLRALERKGYIARGRGARALRVLRTECVVSFACGTSADTTTIAAQARDCGSGA